MVSGARIVYMPADDRFELQLTDGPDFIVNHLPMTREGLLAFLLATEKQVKAAEAQGRLFPPGVVSVAPAAA